MSLTITKVDNGFTVVMTDGQVNDPSRCYLIKSTHVATSFPRLMSVLRERMEQLELDAKHADAEPTRRRR